MASVGLSLEKNTKYMKPKIYAVVLLGVLAFEPLGWSQTDTNAAPMGEMAAQPASPPSPAVSAAGETQTADSDASNETAVAAADTNAPAVAAESTNPPVAASNETAVAAADTNAPMVAAESTNPPVAAGTNAPAPVAGSIPLIQFEDVPLDTAIENLARQAGINYLIDPKIGYGQPDQNGQIKQWPTLSIRWENVTARQALLALLDNYTLQLVEDPRNKIARITAKNPAALPPLITRVIQLKYASTSNMVESVQAALTDRRSKVLPDTRTSQLVIVATQPEQDAVDTLISELDKPTRQVLIETRLVEISSNPSTVKGIDWSGTLAGQNISFGNGILDPTASSTITSLPGTVLANIGQNSGSTPSSSSQTTVTTVPQNSSSSGGLSLNTVSGFAPAIGFLNADGLHAVLSFLNSSSDAQVVSTPRVVTLDNETASIEVTRAFPVINVTAGTANTTGGSQINYSNIGTVFQVTPRITANNYIWLKVIPEVSSFFGKDTETIGGGQNGVQTFTADIFDTRRIETQVMIPNANTLVMGGLVKDNPNASYTKVPILGDIPILGWAFRSESKTLDKDNLIIFITPTILQDSDFQPTTTDFLKSQPNTMKSPMNPNTMWDGAEPRGDWSNPAPEEGEFDKVAPTSEK
jgi:type II secretory pathway component GspD/PulD (secretin)